MEEPKGRNLKFKRDVEKKIRPEEKKPKGESPRFAKEKKLFKKRGFFRQYRVFRKGGLGVLDSFFNAFYILLSEKSVEKEKEKLQSQGETVHHRHFLELHAPSLRIFSSLAKRLQRLTSTSTRRKDQSHAHLSKARFVKEHLPHIAVFLLFTAVTLYIAFTLSVPVVLRAEIDGKVIGVVEDKYVVDSAIDELEANAGIVLGKSFTFPYEVRYTFQRQKAQDLTPQREITTQLYTYVENFICSASGLYVDGTLVAICPDEASVQSALENFSARHHDGKDSGIFNEIRVVTQAYPTEAIITAEELENLLEEMNKPFDERKKAPQESSPLPDVEENKDNSLPVFSLLSDADVTVEMSVGISSHYPSAIDDIKLDFYTAEEESYETEMPYKTHYVESGEHYTCMADITSRGQNGLSRVTAKIYYVDGKEVKREVVEEEVIREPVDHVVSIGTKVLPEELGITDYDRTPYRFIVPRVGYVYSYFGYREDGYHKGWDIPGDEGANLYAAASGTVIVAIGQNGYFSQTPDHSYDGYGYCVVIQHDDGFTTMYAHCYSINVTLGQKVKQGDKIAEVGNTGRSEGNHVHFEIRKDDVCVDPARYLYQGTTTIYDRNKG